MLLDTNVFIIGSLDLSSPEARLFEGIAKTSDIVLVFSNDLEEQLRRVGKRVQSTEKV